MTPGALANRIESQQCINTRLRIIFPQAKPLDIILDFLNLQIIYLPEVAQLSQGSKLLTKSVQ